MKIPSLPLLHQLWAALVLVLLTSSLAAFPVHSQSFPGNPYRVNFQNGLNVRSSDCALVDTIAFGTVVHVHIADWNTGAQYTMTCAIGGTDYDMVRITYYQAGLSSDDVEGGPDMYVAAEFLTSVQMSQHASSFELAVDAPNGFNLRDENCNPVSRGEANAMIAYGFYSQMNTFNCSIGGIQYAMSGFGGYYYATSLLREGVVSRDFVNVTPDMQPTNEMITYTNNAFPDFEMTLDSSWSVKDSVQVSEEDELDTHTIYIMKPRTIVEIKFYPEVVTGCIGDVGRERVLVDTLVHEDGSNIYKYSSPDGYGIDYTHSPIYDYCSIGRLFTTASSAPAEEGSSQMLRYSFIMKIFEHQHADEADQIIRSMKF